MISLNNHPLIIWLGLGNSDTPYQNTRHNVGWLFCDHVVKHLGIDFKSSKYGSVASAQKLVLLKLTGYMNESGYHLQRILSFHKWNLQQTLVVHDDIDFPVGTIKLRTGGSDGGHRGLRSIGEALGTMEFWRLRVGIRGEMPQFQTKEQKDKFIVDYVLSPFTSLERKTVQEVFNKVTPWIADIRDNPTLAMNKINSLSGN